MNSTKKQKRPFKQTKQLIKLALNEGWTQNEIKDACRTQQSIVSAWKNGSKLGTEQQLKPLLELFGHKLRRNSFKVYWNYSDDNEVEFFKVEGKIILSHLMNFDIAQGSIFRISHVPQQKIVIHHQGNNLFRIVYQSYSLPRDLSDKTNQYDQDSLWKSSISEQLALSEVFNALNYFLNEKLKLEKNTGHALMLQFVLRKQLLNHGFSVPDIVEYPAVW